VLLDRANSRPLIMASTGAAWTIEEVAENFRERLFKEHIESASASCRSGAQDFRRARPQGRPVQRRRELITGVYNTWWESDAAMVELNPLAVVEIADGKETSWARRKNFPRRQRAVSHADILAIARLE